jgi:Na+/melibiose symporter-like transporter
VSWLPECAGSIGASLGLWMLSYLGFDASPDAVNSTSAIMGLKYAYALLPTFIFMLAGLVIWNHPITRERQPRIRSAIDRLNARVAANEA